MVVKGGSWFKRGGGLSMKQHHLEIRNRRHQRLRDALENCSFEIILWTEKTRQFIFEDLSGFRCGR